MTQYKNYTVDEWLNYLENLPRQEIQLGLTRVKKVAHTLQLLQPKTTVITVAGTNGKGSTVAALEAIYLTAGYNVASYTSPHLWSFQERIKINQEPITEVALADAFSAVEAARNSTYLSYFEMTTLAALWHFKKHALDVVILEVGLGGRLDATNIIDADLAIITTVHLDHQAFLGHDLETIGHEKAGILRKNKPFIYGDNHLPSSVLQQAKKLACPLLRYGIDYDYEMKESAFQFRSKNSVVDIVEMKLHPKSISAAIQAGFVLNKKLPVTDFHLKKALENRSLSGRLHFIKGKISHLYDVAHNPQAASYLATYIKGLGKFNQLHAVFSAFGDKDILGLLHPLIELIQCWYPSVLVHKRGAVMEQLEYAFRYYDILTTYYKNPLLAYQTAYNQAKIGDLILVYGSFMTVNAILSKASLARETKAEGIKIGNG